MGVATAKIIFVAFFWRGACKFTNIIIIPKKINKCKEKFVIFLLIGIIQKIVQQEQSSTPVDILLDNLIPNSVH